MADNSFPVNLIITYSSNFITYFNVWYVTSIVMFNHVMQSWLPIHSGSYCFTDKKRIRSEGGGGNKWPYQRRSCRFHIVGIPSAEFLDSLLLLILLQKLLRDVKMHVHFCIGKQYARIMVSIKLSLYSQCEHLL